jgi:hypothetical protein
MVILGIIRCIAYFIWKSSYLSVKDRTWLNTVDRSFAYFVQALSLLLIAWSFLGFICALCDLLQITHFGFSTYAPLVGAAFVLVGILIFRLSRGFLKKRQ